MAITYENAQAYFSARNHTKAGIWSAFNASNRQGAIIAARRVISRGLGRALNDNEPAYIEGDRTRDEYSVYEQAIWMLENGQISDGTGSDPIPVITGNQDAAERKGPAALYSPEALRWLGWTGAAAVRG